MPLTPLLRLACLFVLAHSALAQFYDPFDSPITMDPEGKKNWSFFTGDGSARIDFVAAEGVGQVKVDSTSDQRNIWWALIKRDVTPFLDLSGVADHKKELRVEARVRSSHAPRRVNLHVNTTQTKNFHSNLLEFDLAEPNTWYTVSMTTHGFQVTSADEVYAQLALMDWGIGRYEVDIDYFRVDVVDPTTAGPDQGNGTPYHPTIPDVSSFNEVLRVAQDSTVDTREPDANLSDWSVTDRNATAHLLGVNGTCHTVLRWDLSSYAGRNVSGGGLLELTTHSVQRREERTKDFGLVRVVEILGGDPQWSAATVTYNTLCQGKPYPEVFNTQMVIDEEISDGAGAKTLVSLSQAVLQRLIDGRTRGLVIIPLGSVNVAFFSSREAGGASAPVLHFNVK